MLDLGDNQMSMVLDVLQIGRSAFKDKSIDCVALRKTMN